MCHRKQEKNRNILRLKTSKKMRTLSLIKILLVLIKKSVPIKIHHIYLPVPKTSEICSKLTIKTLEGRH